MKEIVKTSRLAGQLEKLFRLINDDWFEGQLDAPVITIQSTPRAYGHYSVAPIWTVNGEEMLLLSLNEIARGEAAQPFTPQSLYEQ